MDFDAEPERWVGLLVAVGVLVPLALWFVVDRAPAWARSLVGVWSALMLVVATAVSLLGTVIVGVLVALPEGFSDDGGTDRRVPMVVLLLLGLLLGLATAIGLPALVPEEQVVADAVPAEDLAVEDEPPVEEETPIPDEPVTHWETHTVTPAVPAGTEAAAAPVGRATLWLLFVGLALALPMVGLPALSAASGTFRFGDVNGWRAAAMVLIGLSSGLPLLLPALGLRLRNAPLVAGVFLAVALLQGVAAAWPDSFTSELWLAFGLGLTAGLLAPTLLRLVGPALTGETGALVGGVLLTVALLSAAAACLARGTLDAFDGFGSGLDDSIVVPAQPGPEISVPAFPSDFPTFVVPTFVVPTFVVPTFEIPTPPTFPPVP